MRTEFRKTSIVRAIDLRDRRRRAGLTTERMADYLEVADSKHVSAIELGRCTLTSERAIRAAYVLGGITVELPGLGMAAIVPVRAPQTAVGGQTRLSPGEAAWIALEEAQEAIESIPAIQRAVARRDREALVALCEQIVCDPRHATELLAEAIDAVDPTIMVEAGVSHSQKLLARGIRVMSTQRPPGAA